MESWWLSWALADQSKAAGHQACSAWGSFFFWEPSVGNGESEQVTFPTFLVAKSETAKGWPAGSKFEFPSLCPVDLGQADCDHLSRVEMLAFLVLCLLWASCTISWLFFKYSSASLCENLSVSPGWLVCSIRLSPGLFWSPRAPTWILGPGQRQMVTCSPGRAQAGLQCTNHKALSV